MRHKEVLIISLFDDYTKKLGELLQTAEYSDSHQVLACTQGVEAVLDLLLVCREKGKKLIWIGNGGSAAIAAHSALDYWRTANIKSISFNEGTLLTCISNDFGYQAVFEKPIEMFAEKEDILIAISSSGQSVNILNAVSLAEKIGCTIITLSGFSKDNLLRKAGDINFYVPSCHYGQVELIHSILCHSFLDLFMAGIKGEQTW